MADLKILTSYNVHIQYQLAGIGERVIANLIDAGFKFLYYLSVFTLSISLDKRPDTTLIVLATAPILLYNPLCEILLQGQTPGMRLREIKVVSLTEKEATIGQYLIRWLFRLIDITLAMGAVALISVAVSEKRQRLGDMAAGTTVVKLKAPVALHDTSVNEDLPIQFPEAYQLGDKEIALIREVLTTGKPNLIKALAQKVKSHLGIQAEMNSKKFLETILNDFNRFYAGGERKM